ncbi:MAG: hypothetical protein NE327_04755 [Lentisphaeraceae bacterium]|nr:hypothetical protein [Lentisphaeraceae bacterium]
MKNSLINSITVLLLIFTLNLRAKDGEKLYISPEQLEKELTEDENVEEKYQGKIIQTHVLVSGIGNGKDGTLYLGGYLQNKRIGVNTKTLDEKTRKKFRGLGDYVLVSGNLAKVGVGSEINNAEIDKVYDFDELKHVKLSYKDFEQDYKRDPQTIYEKHKADYIEFNGKVTAMRNESRYIAHFSIDGGQIEFSLWNDRKRDFLNLSIGDRITFKARLLKVHKGLEFRQVYPISKIKKNNLNPSRPQSTRDLNKLNKYPFKAGYSLGDNPLTFKDAKCKTVEVLDDVIRVEIKPKSLDFPIYAEFKITPVTKNELQQGAEIIFSGSVSYQGDSIKVSECALLNKALRGAISLKR